ncbi:hypothetical protein KI387_004148, partial [Taxus chinensis]
MVETTVGKEIGRVKIEDASVEVGTIIGTFTKGHSCSGNGSNRSRCVSAVETRRD